MLAILALGYKGGTEAFVGGWHWQAFGLALWEQFTGTGLSLGLLVLFAQKLNRDGGVLRWLDRRSFADRRHAGGPLDGNPGSVIHEGARRPRRPAQGHGHDT